MDMRNRLFDPLLQCQLPRGWPCDGFQPALDHLVALFASILGPSSYFWPALPSGKRPPCRSSNPKSEKLNSIRFPSAMDSRVRGTGQYGFPYQPTGSPKPLSVRAWQLRRRRRIEAPDHATIVRSDCAALSRAFSLCPPSTIAYCPLRGPVGSLAWRFVRGGILLAFAQPPRFAVAAIRACRGRFRSPQPTPGDRRWTAAGGINQARSCELSRFPFARRLGRTVQAPRKPKKQQSKGAPRPFWAAKTPERAAASGLLPPLSPKCLTSSSVKTCLRPFLCRCLSRANSAGNFASVVGRGAARAKGVYVTREATGAPHERHGGRAARRLFFCTAVRKRGQLELSIVAIKRSPEVILPELMS